ncbi:hypothetical protein BKA67DRAFT_542149 [Truncatella angustata]|uniref:Uncharacterized protein n=1 Tax=Truncatella angustata TaxID=152316 RepID=A0A9P8U8G2_9PEZI|nr:uncharacterized protein BKA67DRAFT_542149 [Truncatella angustata]KAH6645169.1 hypothetical protein BKA67DRAFT_542149 [Truncatella angustata]
MALLTIFFLMALLPSLIAAEAVTTLSVTLTVTSKIFETIVITTRTESAIPPAIWTTKIIGPTDDFVRTTIYNSVTRTITRATSTCTVSCLPVETTLATFEPDTNGSCLSPSTSKRLVTTVITSIYTVWETQCGFAISAVSSATTSSSFPKYSCDPLVNWSCMGGLFTYPTATYTFSHDTTSTAVLFETTTSSILPCEDTTYFTLSLPTSSSSIKSNHSNSPQTHSSSTSSSSISFHTTAYSTGGEYPTASHTSPPVTAGSMMLAPMVGSKVLIGLLAPVVAVIIGFD